MSLCSARRRLPTTAPRREQELAEVQENLSVVTALEQGKIRVRHIVLSTASEANRVLASLKANADFAELAGRLVLGEDEPTFAL